MANTYNVVNNIDISQVGLSGLLTDAAGRQNVALPIVLGDYKLTNDLQPDQIDTNVSGGAIGFDAATNSALMQTSGNGHHAILQTRQWHPYFNGKAQIPEFTFIGLNQEVNVIKRVGYYSSGTVSPFNTGLDGAFLESSDDIYLCIYRDGTPVLKVPQSQWNDPLNGTGASGITVDWTKFQVVFFDFLYLGGTGLRFFMVCEGRLILVHSYAHSNIVANTIMGTPQQPIRAEIRQSGAGLGTFRFLCAQVSSSGEASQLVGQPRSINTGLSTITLTNSGTAYAVLGYRLKAGYFNIALFQEQIDVVSLAANQAMLWQVIINPTAATGDITTGWAAIPSGANSAAEYWVGTGAQTITPNTGICIAGGTVSTRTSGQSTISKLRRVGRSITGVGEAAYLVLTPLSNNHAIHATISFNEI